LEERFRCFLAVPIDDAIRSVLAAAMGALPRHGLRLVAPESLHLTLRFFGDLSQEEVSRVERHLRESFSRRSAAPFPLHLRGRGLFPPKGAPRVLWVGVSGDLDALADLARRGEEAAASVGLRTESRPFSPHLTVGRVREGNRLSREDLESFLPDRDWGKWLVGDLILMRSFLRPQKGSLYRPLATFNLKEVALSGQESPTHP